MVCVEEDLREREAEEFGKDFILRLGGSGNLICMAVMLI